MKIVYSNNYFSEFKKIAKKINSLYPNWEEVPFEEKQSLINRLIRYYNKIKNKYSRRSLLKVLGVASIFISSIGFSQTFTAPVTQPFSIVNNGAYLFTNEFVDIDNDGDLDLFTVGSYYPYNSHNLFYQENIGTATSPVFDTVKTNPFGFPAGLAGYSYLLDFNLADIDGDGDYDLFATDYYSGDLNYYENKGTSTVPLFNTKVVSPFSSPSFYNELLSDIVDLDGDGDFDILTFSSYGTKFYQNTGTSALAVFTTTPVTNAFGMTASSGDSWFVDFVDFDGDGDLDLFFQDSTGYTGNAVYQENTGTATAPVFGPVQTNPFSLKATYYGMAPELVDIDNDGDLDMFVSVFYGPTIYFENSTTSTSIIELDKIELSVFPVPAIDQLTIQGAKIKSQFKIYSLDGKEVSSGTLNSYTIDVSYLEKGLYIFKLFQDNQQQSIKFTKI